VTRHGGKIQDVTSRALKTYLRETTSPKAVKRLVAAREYLSGRSPAEIESKYGFPEQTVYDWLDRIEARGLEAALVDEEPPGRPPRLHGDRRGAFRRAVAESPAEAGFDAEAWSPRLAQEYLSAEFGLEYSRRHARRLLASARRDSE
jgi:transposase